MKRTELLAWRMSFVVEAFDARRLSVAFLLCLCISSSAPIEVGAKSDRFLQRRAVFFHRHQSLDLLELRLFIFCYCCISSAIFFLCFRINVFPCVISVRLICVCVESLFVATFVRLMFIRAK